jgi:hypothetical protein
MITIDMKFKLFNHLGVCLLTSGFLAIASSAFGQSVELQINGENVQHLTCVKDTQGLMCKTEQRDSQSTQKTADVREAGTAKSLKASTLMPVPQLLSSAQLEFISNVLLGFLYLVLPVGLGLGIFLHDKYYAYRSNLLSTQMELLERLWKQSSQH